MRSFIPILILAVLLVSCSGNTESPIFELMPPSQTKIDFINQLTETDENNIIEYLYFNNGAGVVAGDINNDSLTDLYFISNQGFNKLYLNKGNLVFEDITEKAGVTGTGNWKTGVTMADVNGDNQLDIYVCQVGKYKSLTGKNQLFINKGNNTFKDEAAEYGLDFSGLSTQAAFFDFDLDGDLDMYLVNHSIHTIRSYGDTLLRLNTDSVAGDRLYRNDEVNGKRFFTDVASQSGIYNSQIGYGLGVHISDINNDGFPDIFISNDFHENDYLYINNGNGTFTERIKDFFAHTSRSSMGNDIGDINNDGLQDVLVLDMLPEDDKIRMVSGGEDDYDLHEIRRSFGYFEQFTRNTLQLNMGNGKFSEIGRLAGIFSTDWSWSPLICDLDNDGWKDIFITTGIYRRANDLEYINFLTGGDRFNPKKDNRKLSDSMLYSRMPLQKDVSFLFRNNQDLTFSNMSATWGISREAYSNGSTYADLDNDGDLELIVNNINDHAFIYKNNSSESKSNHFLTVNLKGDGLNSRGTGARVVVFYNDLKQVAEQSPTRGFESATCYKLNFGLGKVEIIDSLIVAWPGNRGEILYNIKTNMVLNLDIRNSKPATTRIQANNSGFLFSETIIPGLEFTHKEDSFNIFMREVLAPHSLTAEGPALATGDINGDKRADIFCGGAKGQESLIFTQLSDGSFSSSTIPTLSKELTADMTDAVFFDADRDGDNDLYIVRGGNELATGNKNLYDILLLNEGKGTFTKKVLSEVSHNGSCVRPCDFDNDNDIDLFVGSRSFTGAYGWPANQFLLENDGKGNFKDVTKTRAGLLINGGMVSDAAWFDYDSDGDFDLALSGEWMNITLLENTKGLFRDITSDASLDKTSGWWYSLKAADVNKDGIMDLIAGNVGLNTILNPSEKEPVEMYLTDFDNNGSLEQIICRNRNGKSYPIANFDEMAVQLAQIKKNYPSIYDFGGKSPQEIFGKKEIEESVKKVARTFESTIFINMGNGEFEKVKLPLQAQFSPVRDIMVDDYNNDGILDVVMVGNDYQVRPTYGRYDAGFGTTLLGKAGQSYNYLSPSSCGFFVNGDSRKAIQLLIKGEKHIVVAVNSGSLKVFKVLN